MDKQRNTTAKKTVGAVSRHESAKTKCLESEKEKEVCLGLDISTTTIGVVLLDRHTGDLRLLDSIKLASTIGLFDKADKAIEKLIELTAGHKVAEVFVEENAKMFAAGGSTADTILTLAKMNGLVSYLVYKQYGCKVHNINVTSARKAVGFINTKSDKRKVKEKVFEFVTDKHPEFPWRTHTAKTGSFKGQEVYDADMKDACDAWVICRGGMRLTLNVS